MTEHTSRSFCNVYTDYHKAQRRAVTYKEAVLLERASWRLAALVEDDAVAGAVLDVILVAVDHVLVNDAIDDLQLDVRLLVLTPSTNTATWKVNT